MPVGPNGELLPYPGDPGFPGGPGPGMPLGGMPPQEMPMGMPPGAMPMDQGMLDPAMQDQGMMPPMPPPDLEAGAAPGMRQAIIGRLEELEMEKAELEAALLEMGSDSPQAAPMPPGLLG